MAIGSAENHSVCASLVAISREIETSNAWIPGPCEGKQHVGHCVLQFQALFLRMKIMIPHAIHVGEPLDLPEPKGYIAEMSSLFFVVWRAVFIRLHHLKPFADDLVDEVVRAGW